MTMQTKWRIGGGVAIALSAAMAYFGVDAEFVRASPLIWLGYWGLFGVLLFVAIFVAVFDMRYVRARYAIERREIFRQTLGKNGAARPGQNEEGANGEDEAQR